MYLTREDIRKAAGELITCGFIGNQIDAELKEILRETQPAGIIFFTRNFESPEHLAELARELKCHRPQDPFLLSIDQEGGRVARVKTPATLWPPMRDLGTIDDPELTYRVGQTLAFELRAMNMDVDFAPVLDVDTNPDNPIIGDRSFGDHPELVSRHGAALVRGLQDAGIGACGKHFPGHGDTDLDSHLDLPIVSHDLRRLREVEWPPFKASIEAGVGAIMTAHVVMEAIDENHPATLTHKALQFLRNELAFDGVVISDDLEMKAVADRYSVAEMAELGMSSGVDHFLACKQPQVVLELYRAIIHAVEKEIISHEDLALKAKRVRKWKERFYKPPVEPNQLKKVGCEEHQRLAQEILTRKMLVTS